MKAKHGVSIAYKLSSLSKSLQRISILYLPYINKLFNILGVKPNDSSPCLPPLNLASIAYFKTLIKDIQQNDSLIDIHTKFILTRPTIEEYIDNLMFIRSFFIYSYADESFFQTYHELFYSNQTVLGLREILSNSITKTQVLNDIQAIFKSESKEDQKIIITLEYLVNELQEINGFFRHIIKMSRQLAHKGITTSYGLISMLLSPTTYTKRLSQCTDMVYSGCSSVYSSIVPNEQMYSQFSVFNQACRNSIQGYSQAIYSSCYQPFENLTVTLKDHAINITANLANSSKKIREKVIEYVTYEVNRLKGTYGNIAASFSIRKDDIVIKVSPIVQEGEVNKEWLKGFLSQINSSYYYIKAKAIIDDFYSKWLQSGKENSDETNIAQISNEEEKNESFDKIVSWGIKRESFDLFSHRFIESEKNLHKYSDAIALETEEDLKLSSFTQVQKSQQVIICDTKDASENDKGDDDMKKPQLMSTIIIPNEEEEEEYPKMTSLNDLIQSNPSFKNEANQSISSINDEENKGHGKKGKKNKKKH